VKLHDLHPAPGSRRDRTRVGRGIAAGKGKTAGRGTKGQKARAGASIPAWFEGGQTPIHIRVPKLRGFKNRFKIQYSVVNVGEISAYAAAGRFGVELEPGARAASGKAGAAKAADKSGAPVTVNAEVLASSGLIGSTERPVKVLGQGDVTEKLFVAADAFSASARRKIEEAGGFVQLLAPETEAKSSAAEPESSESTPVAEAASAQTDTTAAPGATEGSSAGDTKPARKRTAKNLDASES
jgi:large subunit ribosomal protein L15